jgi:hypothetical protein
MDCYTKTITIQGMRNRIIAFKRERRVIANSVISVMMVRRLIQKLLVWDGFMLKHK